MSLSYHLSVSDQPVSFLRHFHGDKEAVCLYYYYPKHALKAFNASMAASTLGDVIPWILYNEGLTRERNYIAHLHSLSTESSRLRTLLQEYRYAQLDHYAADALPMIISTLERVRYPWEERYDEPTFGAYSIVTPWLFYDADIEYNSYTWPSPTQHQEDHVASYIPMEDDDTSSTVKLEEDSPSSASSEAHVPPIPVLFRSRNLRSGREY